MDKKVRLHLGCGEKYLEGYINIDYPPSRHTVMSVRADVYQDIKKLDYQENSIDEVRSHHLFEHFSRVDALKLLFSWRRWLRPGGKLVIETPDFEACCRAYLRAMTQGRRMRIGRHVFGSHEASWAYHYDFWDKAKFEYVLRKLGFKQIRTRQYANSFAKRYSKIPLANTIGRMIPLSFYWKYGGNKLPDIVVTARKDEAIKLDEEIAVREILSNYLTPRDNYRMLNVWLNNFYKDGEGRKK